MKHKPVSDSQFWVVLVQLPGYFVVRMLQSTGKNVVIFGFYTESVDKISRKMPGVALLCLSTPIADGATFVYHKVILWSWGLGLPGLSLVIVCLRRGCRSVRVLKRRISAP